MQKKKFEITVQRTDKYEIEIDPEVVNDEWRKNFETYMWYLDEDCSHENLAKHIGRMRARFGSHQFMEGLGVILVEGEYLTDNEKACLAEGFKLKVISEGREIEVDAREVNP